jgi:hypothetical protein
MALQQLLAKGRQQEFLKRCAESHGFAEALVVQQRSQQLLQPCKGILFRSRVW